METRRRADRFAVVLSPAVLRFFPVEAGPWYESEEEIAQGLAWGQEKARVLAWVRRQMRKRLSAREKECLHLYYFEGLTFRQIGERTHTNPTSAYRAVNRAVRKLKRAAQLAPPAP